MAKVRRRSASPRARTSPPAPAASRTAEGEFDAGESGQVDGGKAGADGAAGLGEVADGGAGAELRAQARGDLLRVGAAGVEEEGADRVAAGRLGDVGGVGDEEAVLRRRGELFGDTGVAEGDGAQGRGAGVLDAQVDGVAGSELEVLDGLDADQQVVRALGQLAHELLGGAAGEVGVLE
ncbi:hypothetical protein [Streptomyces anandii]|uniref:hypothetical protein n=1 Tax=Streptomyces anandii TaxID=285454 RepID=UPI00199E54E7|nr:hypothetical protein [Streptomyces anandii]GGY13533.1 hypothetical protein GCM10010510_69470 [Streptomyces anandii JCM 4720]